jgi:hypothetical protein
MKRRRMKGVKIMVRGWWALESSPADRNDNYELELSRA